MLFTVQTHWLDTCEYFTRVQCANSDEDERELAQELPKVRENLCIILDALLTEKHQLEVFQQAEQQHHEEVACNPHRQPSIASFGSSTTYNTAGTSPDRMNGRLAADASPSSGKWSLAETASTTVPSTLCPLMDNALLDGATPSFSLRQSELPPCYHYLFAPPPSSAAASLCATPNVSDEELPASLTSVPDKPPTEHEDMTPPSHQSVATASIFPDTIGPTFLLTLCLYAKHNQPPGSRTVVLEFLMNLITKADLPIVSRHHSQHYPGQQRSALADLPRRGGTARPCSILQLSLSSSIVPLLDMIRKVGTELDPTHPFGGDGRRSGLGRSFMAESGTLQAETRSDADRTAFVKFLCALAERIEQVPDLANYFIISAPASTVDGSPHGADHFVLLEILLPYMTHDCTAPGWEQRRDTCRFALSAVLSLAKCPDPWVQDIVSANKAIADRTLAAACTTLLTLCKIPDNDDSDVQLLYLRDVLRFWSGLCLLAPAVADSLGIAELAYRDFACTALTSLFMSPDSRVYAAACLVTSVIVADLNSSGPVVPASIARALLATVVDMDTGRRCRHRAGSDYYELMMLSRRGCTPGHDHREDAERVSSFFDYYIVSRLSTQPTLTEEDVTGRAFTNIKISEWTAVEATLSLLKALTENCPCLLAKYAFLVDMDNLSTISLAQPSDAMGKSLSTVSSAPTVDINGLFPATLRSAEGDVRESIGGVSGKQLSEEVMECMLRIESNTPASALYERQRAVLAGAGLATLAESVTATGETLNDKGMENAWFSELTARHAPLTKVLCELLSHFTSVPFRSAILLTQLCVRVCLLPDLRVLYTLLDPERGPLTQALKQLRNHIDQEMQEDEKYAIASAAAAAVAAFSTSTPVMPASPIKSASSAADVMMKETKRARSKSSSRPLDDSVMVELPPTTFTRAYLYELYLAYWEHLPAHILSSLEDERDTRGLERITTPPIISSVVGAPGTVSDAALKALIRHQPFLESCACLEQFRMELDAAVGYMTLSHSLMSLKF